MKRASNKALLGTRHKVSGPQNADVGRKRIMQHMRDRLAGLVILILVTCAYHNSAQQPDISPPFAQETSAPRTLQELAVVASQKIPGTWEIENGTRLCGRAQDAHGDWKGICMLIEHPKYSETGRRAVQEMGTLWSSMQYVVAQNDSFLLIKGYSSSDIQHITQVLGLTMLESPKDIRRFATEDCGLAWNGLILVKEKGGQQSVPGYPPQGVGSPEP